MRDIWHRRIVEIAKKLYGVNEEKLGPVLEPTIDIKFGDLTTGIPFRIAKMIKDSPLKVANELKENLDIEFLEKAQVAGNGYLNLFFSKQFLVDYVSKIVGDDLPKINLGNGKKVLLEFCSGNPTGPLHVAHARQAAIGDSLATILGYAGYDIKREYYVNDTGNQVEMFGESIYSRINNLPIPENGYHGEYVIEIAQKLPKESTKEECSRFGVAQMMNEIKQDLDSFGIHFDVFYSEKEMHESKKVEQVLKILKEKNLSYQKEGATWFRTTPFGDDKDRALVKSTGEYVYRLPDLAYHKDKFDRNYDLIVNLIGPDHHAHVSFMNTALGAIGFDVDKLKYIIVQHCKVMRGNEEVKMSKRAGTFVMLSDLLNEVGKDATRFFFIMRKAESHMDFDLELAKKQTTDNPVYYVQYAHARIESIKRKAERWSDNPDLDLIGEEEKRLIRMIYRFENAVRQAVRDLDPTRITTYLTDLAGEYQSYYQKGDKDKNFRVLSDDENLKSMRIFCSIAVQKVLKKGLTLLGISAPEKM